MEQPEFKSNDYNSRMTFPFSTNLNGFLEREREREFYLIKLTFIHAQGTYFKVNFDTHFITILLSWCFEKAIMKWYMVRERERERERKREKERESFIYLN